MKTNRKKNVKRTLMAAMTAVIFLLSSTPAMAAQQGIDPLTALGNIAKYAIDILTGVGVLVCIFGGVQLALALQANDETQRTKAMMYLGGGALFIGIRFILQAIGITVGA